MYESRGNADLARNIGSGDIGRFRGELKIGKKSNEQCKILK
jgi:hypothetical protein